MTTTDPRDPKAWEEAAAIAKRATSSSVTKKSDAVPFFFHTADGKGVLVHRGKLVTGRGAVVVGAFLRDLGVIRGEGPTIDDVLPVIDTHDALPDVGNVDKRSYVNDRRNARLADLNPRIETDGTTAHVVLQYLVNGPAHVKIDDDLTHKKAQGAPMPSNTKGPVARPMIRMSLTIPSHGDAAWKREDLNWGDFPATTTLEQVTRWAPAGMQVGSLSTAMVGISGIDVPGVDLFRISDPNQAIPANGTRSYQVVAVAGGFGKPILDDTVAIMRAVSAATKDRKALAQVGLLLGQREGEILNAAKTDAERKAYVAPPKLSGTKLEFWIMTTGSSRQLQHVILDLDTAKLTFVSAPAAQIDVIANAIASLATANLALHAEALRTLAKQCATPAAKQAFFDALAKHPQEQTRAAAAEASPACGAVAVDPLIRALGNDPARLVRGKAAFALGAIGDKKAIPALQKAATTDIAAAANIALDKLK